MEIHLLHDLQRNAANGLAYHYFRGRYALGLLADYVESGRTVSAIKSSRWAPLLEKPAVKDVLARSGPRLTRDRLEGYWPDEFESYHVTYGHWGATRSWERDWHQACRRGWNLVLQLNFTGRHDALFAAVESFFGGTLNNNSHPVPQERRTLAWARIDYDAAEREALIEEVQSDWIRDAICDLRDADETVYGGSGRRFVQWGQRRVPLARALHAYRQEIDRHRAIWAEAVLWAAIDVVRRELGARRVYYHTQESNLYLKAMSPGWMPPRSIYSDLPRRFCFRRVRRGPRFLERDDDGYTRYQVNRRRVEWYCLDWDESSLSKRE